MRAAIYARYSSDLQRPTSIEDQIRKCRQAAEQKAWAVLTDYIRSDSELSGASLAPRAGLLSLINDVKKRPRPFDVIVIDDTSRFGRNLTDVLVVSDLVKCQDAFLYFVSQHLDSRDQSFRQLLIMNGMIDEQFLAGLSDKVHRGQEGRVLQGLLPGGRCYGYRNVPVEDCSRRGDYGRFAVIGVRQEISEEEAAVVRRIFQMRSEGCSLASIAITLNSERIPSPRPRRGRIQAWSHHCLYSMLRNTRYRGKVIWNKTHKVRDPESGKKRGKRRPREEWVIVNTPELCIVSDELWEKVESLNKTRQEKFGIQRLGGLERRNTSKSYLFSGLLICACCGYRMVIVSGNGKWAKYGCPNHRFKNACPNNLTINHVRLEEQLIDQIIAVALRADKLEYAISEFHNQLTRAAAQSVLAREKAQEDAPKLRAEVRKLEAQARNLVTAIAEYGTHRSPSLLSELTLVEDRIDRINRLLSESTPKLPDIPVERIREFVQREANNMSTVILGEPAAARQALRTYFKPLFSHPSRPLLDRSLGSMASSTFFLGYLM